MEPDGQKVATASNGRTCRVFDVASKTEELKFEQREKIGRVHSVVWSPDGQKVATSSDKTCRVFDVASRTEVKFQHENDVKSVVLSPDGQKVATASYDETCRVFDLASKRGGKVPAQRPCQLCELESEWAKACHRFLLQRSSA